MERRAVKKNTLISTLSVLYALAVTTINLDGKEYTFMGSDSVYLTDLLLNLRYAPMRVCRCAPEFEMTTEFGGPYGVNLSQGYARCENSQADLALEQIESIVLILETSNDLLDNPVTGDMKQR